MMPWHRTMLLFLVLLPLMAMAETRNLLLLGETGSGKSTFGNIALASPHFNVGHDLKSCTSTIKTAGGPLFGNRAAVLISDTPGLGDTEGRDEDFVEQVASHVRMQGGVHGVIFVHNACLTRINHATQEALLRMLHTLSNQQNVKRLWLRVGVAFTQCLERQPIYEAQFPTELKTRFNLTQSPPMFWITDPTRSMIGSVFDSVRESVFGGWKDAFVAWVENLPAESFKIPDDTTRESLKREFEQNRQRELEEQRLAKEKLIALQKLVEEREHDVRVARLEAEGREANRRQYDERVARLEAEVREANRRPYHYTPTPSYSGGGGSGCFAANSKVFSRTHGEMPIGNLQVGEEVATVGGWTQIVSWMHSEPSSEVEGIIIHYSQGQLELTGDHYVFVKQGSSSPVAIPASYVAVGDELCAGLQAEPVQVTHTERTSMQGYYAPLTTTGDLLVNGVWVSCYVETGLPHALMHVITALWRIPYLPGWLRPQSDATWVMLGGFAKYLSGFGQYSEIRIFNRSQYWQAL